MLPSVIARSSASIIQPAAAKVLPVALPKLKCITFDVIGTLIGYKKHVADEFSDSAAKIMQNDKKVAAQQQKSEEVPGLDHNHLREVFCRALSSMEREHPGYGSLEMSTKEWWRRCVRMASHEAFGPDMDEHKFDQLFQKLYGFLGSERAYFAHDDNIPFLDWAASSGLTLGLISNGNERHQDGLLPLFNLDNRFDFQIFAKHFVSAKPDDRIFNQALLLSGVRHPAEVLHIGSCPWKDCYPAKALGMRSLLLDRDGTYVESSWKVEGLPVIGCLSEAQTWILENGLLDTESASTEMEHRDEYHSRPEPVPAQEATHEESNMTEYEHRVKSDRKKYNYIFF